MTPRSISSAFLVALCALLVVPSVWTQQLPCNDFNACTIDIYDATVGCMHETVVCIDGDECTLDSCNPAVGCTHTSIACDRCFGVNCNNYSDACFWHECDPASGMCVATARDCDDQNACTMDLCFPSTGCTHIFACDDGNACTWDVCNNGMCINISVSCYDGDGCTSDSCDVVTGYCTYTPTNSTNCSCPNGTVADMFNGTCCYPYQLDCSGACFGNKTWDINSVCCEPSYMNCNGICFGSPCNFTVTTGVPTTGESANCADDNVCTTDTYNPQSGCSYTPVSCDDYDPCTYDACNRTVGCVHYPISCDRCLNITCMPSGDWCNWWECNPGNGICELKTVNCDDSNSCTSDTCVSGVFSATCVHTPICGATTASGYATTAVIVSGTGGSTTGYGSSCTYATQYANQTINPPQLVPSSQQSSNVLQVTIQFPFTDGRVVTNISLSSLGACNYPYGPYWTYFEQNCNNVFTSSIPWSIAYSNNSVGCGLSIDNSNPYYLYFTGHATVKYLDYISLTEGGTTLFFTRSSTNYLTFRVVFPKTVSVATTGVIVGDSKVLSAIVQQDFDPSAGGSLTIGLLTNLQYPYQAVWLSLVSMPFGISSSAVTASMPGCSGPTGCTQQWQFHLYRNNTCYFDGTYTAVVAFQCQNGTTNCPLNGTQTATISFRLTSGDVCSIVETNYDLTATLASYATFLPGPNVFFNPSSSFFQNQAAYFAFTIASGGPQIQGIQSLSVFATDKFGVSHLINGNFSSFGSSVFTSPNGSLVVEFHFTFNNQWFNLVPMDSSIPSYIYATATIFYAGVGKRVSLDTKEIAAQLPIVIQPDIEVSAVNVTVQINSTVIDLRMVGSVATFDESQFINALAMAMGIDPKLIKIKEVRSGSVIVTFYFEDSSVRDQASSAIASQALANKFLSSLSDASFNATLSTNGISILSVNSTQSVIDVAITKYVVASTTGSASSTSSTTVDDSQLNSAISLKASLIMVALFCAIVVA